MGKLDGKVAVITGGASGIGRATVRCFVEEGCRVVVADIQDALGRQVAEAFGDWASYIHADVSEEADVQAAIGHAITRFGRLDCLFNNAGGVVPGTGGPVAGIAVADYDRLMAVNVRGVFLGIKHAAPIMVQQRSGSIINNASISGIMVGYANHIYNAAKAAVIQLTRSVATELGESMVRVNCICPGVIATPIHGRAAGLTQEAAEQFVEKIKPSFTESQPIRRPGLPEDVARAALWLASEEASFVNGHALVVDGGLTAGRQWTAYQAEMRETTMLGDVGDPRR